jgi:UDP-N-acetyl-D-glucosamine dehydrogenase
MNLQKSNLNNAMKSAYRVLVVGQGYVGLPLSLGAASAGHSVTGYDIDSLLVNQLNHGICKINSAYESTLRSTIESGNLNFIDLIPGGSTFEIIIICVPTPLSKNKAPDLSFINNAIKEISSIVNQDSLVIIESTVAIGTVRNVILKELAKNSQLQESKLKVAFSPERIDPHNMSWNLINTPKLISAISPIALDLAYKFYSTFLNHLVVCDSVEVAEAAKLLENSFRLINISFINEMSIYCEKIGIDIKKVIEAASSKPFGFMPFFPSLGAGGHCIPVDPIYLLEKAKLMNVPINMIEEAIQVNDKLPLYFVRRAEEKINGLEGRKILIVGIAYKANVADTRETPVEPLIYLLRERGAKVLWHDSLVNIWNNEKSVEISSAYDLAILATVHDNADLTKLGSVPILDTRSSI